MPGVRLEPLGVAWGAYSPASGETHLVNDESAALLEWLLEVGQAADSLMAAESFAPDIGLDVDTLRARIDLSWVPLLQAGLVRRVDP